MLKREYIERKRKYNTRRTHREEQIKRMATGEIKPYQQWIAEE